uniref:Uncharacterized protein n=1 Tax=Kalanchoe fedtschenkoi TaxID=63787 RepID=A0A7N0T5T8_KALFE
MDGWKLEALPPVEVPAASKWKFRSKPVKKIILDYDYTFTTPYCGSETIETTAEVCSKAFHRPPLPYYFYLIICDFSGDC